MGAYIWSPDQRTVDFSVGSDDARKVWIGADGNLDHKQCTDQGLEVDASTFSKTLDKGRNLVLMMVSEDSGGWGGQWRISSGNSGLQYNVRRASPEPTVEIGAPDAFDPSPKEGAENLSLSVDLSVNVTDPENDNLNVSFSARGDCPNGWTRLDGVCYNESLSTMSWTNSRDYCNSKGGHLVTINDAEENDALTSRFGGDFWIGYNDRDVEGEFEWINGSSSYKNWSANEPNDSGGEDCTEVYAGGGWNDYQCDSTSEQTAMCEKIPEQYVIGNRTSVTSGTQAETTFSNLEANETYYWSVEVTDGFSTTEAGAWSFSTVPSSLCDFRGPKNECIVETEKNISAKDFSRQEIFETRESSSLKSFFGSSNIFISNKSALSGSFEGSINMSATEVTIKPYAEFRPEGRIVIDER